MSRRSFTCSGSADPAKARRSARVSVAAQFPESHPIRGPFGSRTAAFRSRISIATQPVAGNRNAPQSDISERTTPRPAHRPPFAAANDRSSRALVESTGIAFGLGLLLGAVVTRK
jgi:hypothetical protein